MSQPVEIFISYSDDPEDKTLCLELVEHLSLLQRQGVISIWHKDLVDAGEDIAARIQERLDAANIILPLISSDYLASDQSYKVELARALQRHKLGEAKLIPVVLRECGWEYAFSESYIKPLPRDSRPITSWPNRDEAFKDVFNGVYQTVDRLRSKSDSRDKAPVWNVGKTKLPELLPYLCDRSDQERRLSAEMRRYLKERPQRPIICIVHGSAMECFPHFLERLRYRSLPKLLDLESKQMSVSEFPLERPNRKITDPNAFWEFFGGALLDDPMAYPQDIFACISKHEEPLMFSMELYTEDLERCGEEMVKKFIEFSGDWPDLPAGRMVIDFLCVKYTPVRNAGWFDFKKKGLQKMNERLREFIETMDFSREEKVSGIVLPELKAISLGEADDWRRSEAVRNFRQIKDTEIRALFEREDLRNEDGNISMEILAEEFKRLMSG